MQVSRMISLLLAALLLVAAGFALKTTHDDSSSGDLKDCEAKLESTSRFLLPFSVALIVFALLLGGVSLWESRSDAFGY